MRPARERRGRRLRAARSAALFEKVLGPEGKRARKAVHRTSPDLARLYVEYPFGQIYSRRGLDLKTRELTALAALAALGNARPQLKMHVHGALNVGCSRTQILEVLLMTTVFAGFPAALNAVDAAREAFEERSALRRKGAKA